MELRRFIGAGIAVSALVHLTVLAMVVFFAEVHPFGSVTAEPIAVEIVAPDETGEPAKDEPPPPKKEASDSFDLSSNSAASSSPAPAAPQQAAAAQPQQPSAPSPSVQSANAQPSSPPQQQPPATTPSPAYVPPEPDLSIKYHVMLGLPPALPPPTASLPIAGDGIDATASSTADIASSVVAEFRRHLRTCSKLPSSIAPSDNLMVKLRVIMTPQGKLAAEPLLVAGTGDPRGLDLKQSAISALIACQPYAMLPLDRYGEWKVLDLSFTPKDFSGAS